jgi:hypothetical protein
LNSNQFTNIRSYRLGIRGERLVGRAPEELRTLGYRVFHDIQSDEVGGPFNIDHLLIGPVGVFVVETKTISKPGKGRPTVTCDGERVRVDGYEPDRDPVVQARAQADYIRKKFKDMTGRRVEARPVVLYPTWYVEGFDERHQVWVLNDKMLAPILRPQGDGLSREDIALYADRIENLLTRS